jgi:hypothetical protein
MLYPKIMQRVIDTSVISCDRFSEIPSLIESGARCVIEMKYRSSLIGRFVKFDDYEDLKRRNMVRFCLDAHKKDGVKDTIETSRIFNVEDFKSICTTSYID